MTQPVTEAATTPTAATTAAATTATTTPTDPAAATAGTDWKAEARKWEGRAKENADAAARLAQFEEAGKTEAQKQADRTAAAEKTAAEAKADALRWRVAAKHGISDADAETFLTGTDEASLVAQAERLSALAKTASVTPKPDLTQGAHAETATGGPAQDFANFLQGQIKR